MTDQELQDLRGWAAEKVMGWKWTTFEPLPYDKRDEWGFIVREEDGSPLICYHHRTPEWLRPDNTYLDPKCWHPDTNLNQTFMVVERMRELGFNFCIICQQDGVNIASFTKGKNFSGYVDEDIQPSPLAILLAAKAALEGNDG